MARILLKAAVWLSASVGALVLVGAVFLFRGGIGAQAEPGAMETAIARGLRSLAIPPADRRRANPEPQTPETLRSALEHFADHCAVCHANDGSGDTPIGRKLYPRAPDMRLDHTQALSDGELFYIIERGVRLTGMPAWGSGTSEGVRASWNLVQFIRHLPRLTTDELESMRQFNPKTQAEWQEQEEERAFLAGETNQPPAASKRPHEHE